jgi:hypothetical protein
VTGLRGFGTVSLGHRLDACPAPASSDTKLNLIAMTASAVALIGCFVAIREQHAEVERDGYEAHGEATTLLERMEMRNASGTFWQPESTPMTAPHGASGAIRWMGGHSHWAAG